MTSNVSRGYVQIMLLQVDTDLIDKIILSGQRCLDSFEAGRRQCIHRTDIITVDFKAVLWWHRLA